MHPLALAFMSFTSPSFWLNFLTLAFLAFGIVLALRKPAERSAPYAAVIRFAPLFFSLPLALFGMQHFAFQSDVVQAVPAFMPKPMFWEWLVGAGLIAASLSIMTGKLAQWAALLLGIMFLFFVALIWIPNFSQSPTDRLSYSLFGRDLALSGASLCLAGTLMARTHARLAYWLRLIGRCFFAVPMIVFGVEHFLYPHTVPGVPLDKPMPAWLLAPVAWSWLTGAILLIAGFAILLNRRGSLAAVIIGITYLVLVLVIYIPMELIHPSVAISGELDFVTDTLIFAGAALFVARSLSVPDSGRTT
ncbi:MAG TPA: hypothetical protein VF753_12870 [Terriglobales bacterium]